MILRNPEAEETKELAKWEMFPSEYTIGGLQPGNPYRNGNDYGKAGAAFPKMIYKARRLPGSGKWACFAPQPAYIGFRDEQDWNRACMDAERFQQDCTRTVHNEREWEKAKDDGWRDGPDLAVQYQLDLEAEVAEVAAERNWQDRDMTERAKSESGKAESEHFGHLGEIPESPIRRRVKRAKKGAAGATA